MPAWVGARIDEDAPLIAGILGLARVPAIGVAFDPKGAPVGVRVIDAAAEPGRIGILLQGSWAENSDAAQRQLTRLLAHELAHIWQHSIGFPSEPRLLHEGFAEALAIEALRSCGVSCRADAEGLYRQQKGSCAEAMRMGTLITSNERSAVYGCGSVLVLTAAEKAGLSVAELYLAMAGGERSFEGFILTLEETAGRDFALSARVFLTGDLRLAKPQRVYERLRAGRL